MCVNSQTMESLTARNTVRRQYKKDTLYVLDLYTLTYDSHETLDSLGEFVSNIFEVYYVKSIETVSRYLDKTNFSSLHK
jgi:hypothetical protein